jgi:hypothetical protein
MLFALAAAGVFTVLLGVVHFAMPVLFDFRTAKGAPLRPFRLGFYRYATRRSDVHGLAWVMNHAASWTLVGIGAADLFAASWLGTPHGRWLAAWIAGWWFLRAATQLHIGRRRGDLVILAWFAMLGALHVAAVFA